MCCALNHGCHYCSGRVELNTFTQIVKAGINSCPLQQMRVVSVNVDMGYGNKTTTNNNIKNHLPLLLDRHNFIKTHDSSLSTPCRADFRLLKSLIGPFLVHNAIETCGDLRSRIDFMEDLLFFSFF